MGSLDVRDGPDFAAGPARGILLEGRASREGGREDFGFSDTFAGELEEALSGGVGAFFGDATLEETGTGGFEAEAFNRFGREDAGCLTCAFEAGRGRATLFAGLLFGSLRDTGGLEKTGVRAPGALIREFVCSSLTPAAPEPDGLTCTLRAGDRLGSSRVV